MSNSSDDGCGSCFLVIIIVFLILYLVNWVEEVANGIKRSIISKITEIKFLILDTTIGSYSNDAINTIADLADVSYGIGFIIFVIMVFIIFSILLSTLKSKLKSK